MPMFNEEPHVSIESLEKYSSKTWPELNKFDSVKITNNVYSFNIGYSLVAIAIIRAPISLEALEGPCQTSILWPDAKKEIEKHKFHLIATVSSDELSEIELSTLLTKVTAALMAVTPGAIGVYWGNSTMVIPKNLFIDFAIEVLPEGPPIHIWVDFRVGKGEKNNSSGFTTGLASLGLMEIEAVNSPETVPELRDRLTGIADYLIENGLVIKDGDTVGEDDNDKIKVMYEESYFGIEGKVMALIYARN
jgi:hypothetical protein